jgi:hypothetical protein
VHEWATVTVFPEALMVLSSVVCMPLVEYRNYAAKKADLFTALILAR